MGRVSDAFTVSHWFDNGVLVSKRIIFLENDGNVPEGVERNEVLSPMASRFIKAMNLLEATSKTDEIMVLMNTPGGCVYSGFAIYDRIIESPCHVTVRGYGQIMSMGAIILQSADERQLAPSSWIMIHEGLNDVTDASVKSVLNWGKAFKEMDKRMHEILLENMKKKNKKITLRRVEEMFKDDFVCDADRAVELGLADKIYKGGS